MVGTFIGKINSFKIYPDFSPYLPPFLPTIGKVSGSVWACIFAQSKSHNNAVIWPVYSDNK